MQKTKLCYSCTAITYLKLDNITQQVRMVKGVSIADLFIPKKIELPQQWIKDTIKSSKSSGKLHLMYQTN
ncbi:hypothetical protein QVH35_03850 [Candidatus Nitrosotenuis chungbukensis]|uniref:hypothetical protein n=1 Tax=Candidatus Nitrosotenuis chungbukensis TaxID=1353246 RepID=UPI002672E156|nr:hypothetical protein [Candidatus Nitrosotenuis chungbukensis]WKT58525.1 hypothetical protein QVH35_03850 [Candidatus Nitrosotenuis chungbukensis]